MKVTVDLDRCQGYVCCVMEAPEVFDVDDDTAKVALLSARPPGELRDKVEAAARTCPTQAITVTESED